MNATSLPAWLSVSDIVDSEASHSTTKGKSSSMGFSDATSRSFFTALNAFSAWVDRGNYFTFIRDWILDENSGIHLA